MTGGREPGGGGESGDTEGDVEGATGAWDGAALLLALGVTEIWGGREELSGEMLGLEPFGLTLKSNPDGAGEVGLSEGTGVSDDWAT